MWESQIVKWNKTRKSDIEIKYRIIKGRRVFTIPWRTAIEKALKYQPKRNNTEATQLKKRCSTGSLNESGTK